MSSDAVEDKVAEAMRGFRFEIIATNLSKEDEAKPLETFAEEEMAPVRWTLI
jgi:uncharacterized membrane protein